MNPSEWLYHLNTRAMLEENGFLDPCANARPRRERVRLPRRAPRAAAVVLALLPVLLAGAVALLGG